MKERQEGDIDTSHYDEAVKRGDQRVAREEQAEQERDAEFEASKKNERTMNRQEAAEAAAASGGGQTPFRAWLNQQKGADSVSKPVSVQRGHDLEH